MVLLPTSGRARWTPILMFHEILPAAAAAGSPYATTPAKLRAILEDFTRRGYTAGTLDDVLTPGPARRLVLTFDDGTADFMEHALPVLEEFDCRATLFIVAGAVGGRRTWAARDGAPLPAVPLLAASELRALAGCNFSIGSHTLTHRVLTDLPPAQAEEEIRGSRARLTDLLGRPVDWFAYPYVALDPAVQRRVRDAGYAGACGGYQQAHGRYHLIRLDAAVFSVADLRRRSSALFHLVRGLRRRARQTPTR
ncbi:MAG TPA: polysaccharide deacetylase family protein [Chloroflexia bacterium]|nr:polysaccharide deacetylase family protein [Chloroflexia bacterium]